MIIRGFTRQNEGGGFYRMRMPLEELAKHGHQTEIRPAHSEEGTGGADIVVGQMIGHKQQPAIVHSWWRGMAKYARRVYELDDDPFTVEPHNPAFSFYSGEVSHDSLTHCIQTADLVTASTVPLAERMSKLNPNVVVLKNRIDEHMLSIERPRREKLTIGWAGSNTHLEDLKLAAWGLRKTLEHHPGVDAHFIGADYRSLIKRPIRFTPWAQRTTDYYKLIDFDIGLAPLRSTVFSRSKSAIKAMEYGALGIPVIASAARPYEDYVIDGVTGFLVRHDHEWAHRLRDLINDDAMRIEMGQKARELAAEHTIQKGWVEWQTAYESLL